MICERIPDSISRFRHAPCTEIKEIGSYYYVYTLRFCYPVVNGERRPKEQLI